jgi:hypothetical protein
MGREHDRELEAIKKPVDPLSLAIRKPDDPIGLASAGGASDDAAVEGTEQVAMAGAARADDDKREEIKKPDDPLG